MNIIRKFISRNYTKGRGSSRVRRIIIHTYGGGGTTLFNWFNRVVAVGKSGSSAHYAVFKDGTVEQYVDDRDTAYHASNWNINQESIGIEHQDDANPADSTRTPQQYESSAQLVALKCREHNIPCNAQFIEPHRKYATDGRSCPGGLDINRIINRANEILQGAVPTPAPTPNIGRLEGDFFILARGGWRSEVITEIIKAGVWGGNWQDHDAEFTAMNPATPAGGWVSGSRVRVRPEAKPTQPEVPKENPMEVEQYKQENARLNVTVVNLTNENKSLSINLKEWQDKHDKLNDEYTIYKNDIEIRFNLVDEKLKSFEDLTGKQTEIINNQGAEIKSLQSDNQRLNLKVEEVSRERDAYKLENDMWKGKAMSTGLQPSDFPSKFMFYWKKFEAQYGKKFTHTLTEFLPMGISGALLWLVSVIEQTTPQQLTSELGVSLGIIYVLIRTAVISFMKDKSNGNKIFLNIIHLFNPQYDPYGNRREVLDQVQEKALQ